MSVECPEVDEYRTALEYAASREVFLTSGAVEILADAAIAALEVLVAERDRMLRLAAMDWAMQWYPSPEWDCMAAEHITHLRIRAERGTP